MKRAVNELKRFFPVLLCVVVFWATMPVFAGEKPLPSGPDEQLGRAESYHKERDYSTAAAIYKDIIERHSGTIHASQAHKALIMLLIDSKDYPKAEAAFEDMVNAIASDPNLPKAIYEIARKYEAEKRRHSAQQLYHLLRETYPNDQYVLWAKGRMVVLGIEFADAPRAQKAMDKLIADSRAHPDVGRLFSEIANHLPEIYRTRRTEKYEQIDGGPRVHTGNSGGTARNRDEEQLLYEYVIEQHPATVYALHALKNLACRHIAEIKRHPEEIVVSKIGLRRIYLLNDERLQQAAACIDKLFEDFSGHRDFPGALFDIAERYRWSLKQRPQVAENLYRHVIDEHKNTEYSMKAQKSLVLLYRDTGQNLRASEALQELLPDNINDPNLPRLVYDIALYLETEERNKPERAEPFYSYLVEEYPKTRYGVLARGRLLGIQIKRGDDNALLPGLEELMRSIEKGQATPKAILDVARSFAYASNRTGEIEVLEFLCEEFPESPEMCHALHRIGRCYRMIKDYETAVKYYKRVLNEYPNSTYARSLPRYIGYTYKCAGDADQAFYWYDRQIERADDDSNADGAMFGKYTVYRDTLKDYDKAIEALREYQAKFPEGSKAHIIPYCLGKLVSKDAKCKAKAIEVLEEGLPACQKIEIADKYREKLDELRNNLN